MRIRLVRLIMIAVCFSVCVAACAQDQAAQGEPSDKLDALSVLPKVFRAAEEAVRPALVTIESFGGVSAVEGKIGGIRSRGEGNTTGVMVSSDGHIVTSTFNFIRRPPVITVIPFDGKRRVAKLLGRDNIRKICLLKIDDVEGLTVPEMVSPADVKVGQWALSLGVGYGDLSPAMSIGIVSAKNRVGGRAIQTDANISPANYGGPLIDLEGRVIGICVPLSPSSSAVGSGVEWYDSGIGFAVPLAEADALIERLKRGDSIEPAFLGIRSISNPTGDGVWVEEAIKGNAAKEAGILREDVITELNGQPIANPVALGTMLGKCEAGQKVKLTVIREGATQPQTIEVTLGSPPPPKGKRHPLEPPATR